MKGDIELSTGDGRRFSAYVADASGGAGPGIVLLQEIFGINGNIRLIADRLSEQGFCVAAPDLFWRQEPGLQLDPSREADRDKAMRLFKVMDESAAVADAALAMEWLRNREACTGKVGALGYCLGGKLAYLMAARTTVDAAVSYYGVGIHSALNEAGTIKVPVLLHIAGQDQLCPPEAQARIVDAMRQSSAPISTQVYPDAGHGFARFGGTLYHAESAELADKRSLDFLHSSLGGRRP